MIQIERYFSNPFSSREFAAEELRSFAEDHIGKLRAQNAAGPLAGTLGDMITATTAMFDPFDEALTNRANDLGTQVGGTMTKDDAVRLFKTTIRQREGLVRNILGEKSAAYREVFPGGLQYYTRATMQTIKQRLDYAVEKFTKYQAQLGAASVTEMTNLRTSFVNARTSQEDDKGGVSVARGAVKATRAALEMQMLDNLLTLAKMFKGETAKATEFFNQSLLEDPQRQKNGGETPAPK